MTHRPHRRTSHPSTLQELEGHVPDAFIKGSEAASRAFRKAGIPHVLVGGLAVGVCGYPRPTKDIDFLVGDEAFEFHGPLVTHRPGLPISYEGIGIDWVSLEPNERAAFEEFLVVPNGDEVPVISVEPLIAMKLIAGRHKDQTDVIELVKAGADIDSVHNFVAQNFPKKLALLDRLVATAEAEE